MLKFRMPLIGSLFILSILELAIRIALTGMLSKDYKKVKDGKTYFALYILANIYTMFAVIITFVKYLLLKWTGKIEEHEKRSKAYDASDQSV